MAVTGQGEEARRFARALGLDPTKTRSITLKIAASEVVTVEVEMMPSAKDLELLGLELRQFELVPIDGKGKPTGTLTAKKDV